MEFGLSEEQTLLQDSLKRYLTEQVPLDVVRKVADGEISNATVWQGLADLGITSLLIPEALGGIGLGSLDAAVVSECLGYHVAPVPFLSTAVIAPAVLAASVGHEEILGGIAAGEHQTGVAFGEAIGARADAGITIERGRISGKSIFVLNADADDYLVADSNRHIYLVSASAKGLARTSLPIVDRTRSVCQLVYDNVEAQLVSDDPDVFESTLDLARVMQAADTLGAAQCMLDQAVAYAKQREQFNRVIASFQAVKHMCAEMAAAIEPCRSFVWYAAHALDELPAEKHLTACHSKAHLQEAGKQVSKTSTEVHGGMGFTDLVGLHYWFKRIGANRQLLGTPEMLREEAARVQGIAA